MKILVREGKGGILSLSNFPIPSRNLRSLRGGVMVLSSTALWWPTRLLSYRLGESGGCCQEEGVGWFGSAVQCTDIQYFPQTSSGNPWGETPFLIHWELTGVHESFFLFLVPPEPKFPDLPDVST